MYKVLIVDDEKPIVDGLKVFINWKELGFEIVAEGMNGQAGVELAQCFMPHVIITDIRMPLIDGLEMIDRVKEFNPACRFIILSGYSDFEYAREAVTKGAFCYLLKPVKEKELVKNLLSIKEELEMENYKKKEEEKLKKQLYESLPVLRERYLNEIISGETTDEEEILRRWAFLDNGYALDIFCVLIAEIDELYEKYKSNIKERLLIKFAVNNVMEEIVEHYGAGVVFSHTHDKLVVLCCTSKDGTIDAQYVFNLASRIRYCVEKYLDETVTIASGGIYTKAADLARSFSEAERALKYKLIYGNNTFISINDIGLPGGKFSVPVDLERKLLTFVEIGQKHEALLCLDEIFRQIAALPLCKPEFFQQVCLDILVLISRYILSTRGEWENVLFNEAFSLKALLDARTIDNLRILMEKAISEVINRINTMRNKKIKDAIGSIKEYIEDNYSEELTLDSVAGKFYMSPCYLSQLFKKELGYNFLEYITLIRIENAKKLLLDPESRAYEVANKVGYSNQRYFSQIFKKYAGCTPTEFRQKELDL